MNLDSSTTNKFYPSQAGESVTSAKPFDAVPPNAFDDLETFVYKDLCGPANVNSDPCTLSAIRQEVLWSPLSVPDDLNPDNMTMMHKTTPEAIPPAARQFTATEQDSIFDLDADGFVEHLRQCHKLEWPDHQSTGSRIIREQFENVKDAVLQLRERIHRTIQTTTHRIRSSAAGADAAAVETKVTEIVSPMRAQMQEAETNAELMLVANARALLVKKRNMSKLEKNTVRVLEDWFLDNFEHPYPSPTVKEQLMEETGLTKTQLNNWFINKRVRAWHPRKKEQYMNQ